MLERLPPSRVLYEWDAIGRALAPAIKAGEPISLDEVRLSLLSGRFDGWKVSRVGDVYVVTWRALTRDGDRPAMWVLFAGGRMFGGPKRRLAAMRDVLRLFEDEARWRRCAEMRIEDRDWSLVATDYLRTTKPDGGILLRKVL